MTEQEEIINTIKVLRKEVEVLTTRLRPAGTGHLITAIGVINSHIDELIGSAIDGQPDQVRGLAGKIFIGDTDEDVYDGYKEHTEAMEQARLRGIQDSAAGRKPNKVRDAYLWSADKEGHWSPDDDVEHTKEYYTGRARNRAVETIRPMEGEDLPVKRKMTVSEMMQDELEPLPINTFK